MTSNNGPSLATTKNAGANAIECSFVMTRLAPVLAKAEIDSVRLARRAADLTLHATGLVLVCLGEVLIKAGERRIVSNGRTRFAGKEGEAPTP